MLCKEFNFMTKKIKILLACDNISLIELVKKNVFLQNDWDVLFVQVKSELNIKIQSHKPDIIILDSALEGAQIPDILSLFYETPIILLTDSTNEINFDKYSNLKFVKKYQEITQTLPEIALEIQQIISTIYNNLEKEELISKIFDLENRLNECKLKNIRLIEEKGKSEDSNKQKSAFLANMSHEIRTPMNGIIGFSELLENSSVTDEQKCSYMRIIKKSAVDLLSIINDIVDISKIETGQVKLSSNVVKVEDLINETFNFFRPIAQSKNLLLNSDFKIPVKDFVIVTDEIKLKQVLTNLVNNAVKFTDKGSITIGVQNRDHNIEFFVQDTGVGIPNKYRTLIFDRFRQAEYNNARKHGGSGLGLAISKAYVELLGGDIWVESEVGKGSTFFFTLPMAKQKARKNTNNNENIYLENCLTGKTVLVAEDELVNYLYASEVIQKTGAQIIRAEDGTIVLDMLKHKTKADIILMDIKMPTKNGIDTAVEIRKSGNNIPIIAVTAFALTDDKQKALKAGCNAFLHKPYRSAELIHLLVNLLNVN
jgi:signal transduction histidine kinase